MLNFREWHLSSKSWSTRLLPKITTVQGYFSYNSSGFWLSFLLINCLHITLVISIRELVVPTHSQGPGVGQLQNPPSRAGWAESCVFTSQRKPTFDLYLLPSSTPPPFLSLLKFCLVLGCFYKTIIFLNIPWQFTSRETRIILVNPKWRDFSRLWKVAMLWIANFLKMLSVNSMCSDQSVDSHSASSSCHIVLAFQVFTYSQEVLVFLTKIREFPTFYPLKYQAFIYLFG